MRIEQFDPAADPEQLRACHRLFTAGGHVDDPHRPPMSWAYFAGWWICGWIGYPREVWLATDPDAGPVGCYLLELPHRDNTGIAEVCPIVAPARRRSGIGTALLRHAARRAARSRRQLLTGETIADTPGARFALARGALLGLTEIRSTLDLSAVDAERICMLRARAGSAAARYSVLSWRGTVPAEYREQVAAVNEAMADAPRLPGEEPTSWDDTGIRAVNRRVAMQGLRYYSVAARCTATGNLPPSPSSASTPGHLPGDTRS
jgi:GNAT superfamily N-acetyltransferase